VDEEVHANQVVDVETIVATATSAAMNNAMNAADSSDSEVEISPEEELQRAILASLTHL